MAMIVPVALLLLVNAAIAMGKGASGSPQKELTNDGMEFTINRKDFKISQFELYGRTYDDNYGFVDEAALPLDNRGYAEVSTACVRFFLADPNRTGLC
jgi:hypothetical protein